MPLQGGPAAKYGNRYEDRWTAHCVFELLREHAEAIRVEPPGADGEGVEFWLRYSDRVEYHQVKRQKAGEGRWTLSALREAGVLAAFWTKLQDPGAHCVFASTHAAHPLDELADRARKAQSTIEFQQDLLDSQSSKTDFETLHRLWGKPDVAATFDALRRIRVETITEALLTTMNSLEAETLLDGDTANAVPVLIDILRDAVNEYLTAHDIWSRLAPHHYEPSKWRGSATLAAAVMEANRRFRASRETTLIGRRLIDRPEAETLVAAIAEQPLVLLDGAAGMGKSDLLVQFTDVLAERGVPYLALRLDHLTPTFRPDTLGQELGLPGSPPAVLAAVAPEQMAVLVVDQLDVVSTTSGRSPEFFECVNELVKLIHSQANLRIVLSCRTFDVENDARLRRLVHGEAQAPVITVGPLAEAQVMAAVESFGHQSAALTPTQRELLGVPLHLALLGEIAASTPARTLDFSTARDLYDKFWLHKRQQAQARLNRPLAWTEIIDRLVDYMSAHQLLQAPAELLDDWQLDAEEMVSSRVLMRAGRQVGFFHETFFDYAFARRFTARGYTIPLLLADDQFLFRRAQVRQILAHERDGAAQAYHDDLGYLVTNPDVRFHLRDLVMSWLSQVVPTEIEWRLVEPILSDPAAPLHSRAWQTLASAGWFAYADQNGYLARRLEADDELTNATVQVLSNAGQAEPGRVAALLRPYVNASAEWTHRIVWVLSRAKLSGDRALFDVLVALVDCDEHGVVGSIGRNLWLAAHDLPKEEPGWACELLGRYLANRITAATAAGVANPFERQASIIPRDLHLYEYVVEAAAGAPGAFIEHVWPAMLTVSERTGAQVREDELWPDHWDRHYVRDAHGALDDHLLLGAERAFAAFAREEPEQFAELVATHRTSSYDSVVYFLYQGFAGNPERFADMAIDFLVDDHRRLRVGYAAGDHHGTRRLLQAITPHASPDALGRLDSLLCGYYTSWERSAAGHQEFGLSQFILLAAIPEGRRSEPVRRRLAEWQRKFLVDDVPEPLSVGGGVVQSPIGEDAQRKMSDAQWLRAIAHYPDDRRREGRSFLEGGARQLAGGLEQRVKEDPTRFARLVLAFPDETSTDYFDAVLRGVWSSEHRVLLEDTARLLERCHRLPGRPCGRWIAQPLVKHADDAIPEELLELVGWYAIHGEASAGGTVGSSTGGDDEGGLLQHGINTVRGGVAYEIAQLVSGRPENLAPLRPAVEALVVDRVTAVRAVAAGVVVGLLRHHRDVALALFMQLISDSDDRLLASRDVHEFLRYLGSSEFQRLRPVMERMLASTVPKVREAGAVQATLAALDEGRAEDLAAMALVGNDEQRVGAARVYASNLTSARFQARCEEALTRLFDDPSRPVREAAATVIRRLEGTQLGEFKSLVQCFIASRALTDRQDEMLSALIQTTASVPTLALDACDRVLAGFGAEASDIRMAAARQADQVSQIVVRAYADSPDRPTKERALDLIDRSLELNIYGAHQALVDHDRV
jgi:hypothetical protein